MMKHQKSIKCQSKSTFWLICWLCDTMFTLLFKNLHVISCTNDEFRLRIKLSFYSFYGNKSHFFSISFGWFSFFFPIFLFFSSTNWHSAHSWRTFSLCKSQFYMERFTQIRNESMLFVLHTKLLKNTYSNVTHLTRSN